MRTWLKIPLGSREVEGVGLTASRKPFIPFQSWSGEWNVEEGISDLRIGTLTADLNPCISCSAQRNCFNSYSLTDHWTTVWGKWWQGETEERRRHLANTFKSCLSHPRSSHVGTALPAISFTGG